MSIENNTYKSFNSMSESFRNSLIGKLEKPARILITSHKNPDGDAVGSALGLAGVLESLGHQVKVYLPDEAPDFLKWMPGYSRAMIYEKSAKHFPGFEQEPDVIFFLDFNSLERLGEMEIAVRDLNSMKIIVDHHPGGNQFYDFGIINTEKGSTSELVFLLLEQMNLLDKLDSETATCLYAGIITDTLGLQVSSSYNEVYRVIGLLVDMGAKIETVYDGIYNQFSQSRMKLLGYCLSEKMKVLPEFGAAYIWLTKEDLAKFNHIKGDTEGFVNYPLSIKDIRFTVLFTELEGEIKLSLRSKGNIPVNKFAADFFDGGGHKNASGGRSQLTMEETITKFEKHLKEFMTSLQNQ